MKIKSLFHRPERFTQNESTLSPAEKASRKWDAREGEIIEQNTNLRRLLVGLMVVIVALGSALAYKAISENYLVYVVETDIKTGEVRNVGTANKMNNYKPSEQVYNFFIRQFVTDIRSIPLDEVVYKQQLEEASAFLTKDGANLLTSVMQKEDRVNMLGKSTVQVTVNSVLPMQGGKSYQVRWTEVEYSQGATNKKITPYTGVFTVELIQSKDEKQLAVNPLGMYISDFRYEKDTTSTSDNKNSTSTANTSSAAANRK